MSNFAIHSRQTVLLALQRTSEQDIDQAPVSPTVEAASQTIASKSVAASSPIRTAMRPGLKAGNTFDLPSGSMFSGAVSFTQRTDFVTAQGSGLTREMQLAAAPARRQQQLPKVDESCRI